MKRAAPFLLFGALTIFCFWRFLFLGWTLYDVRTLEGHLGIRPPEAPSWFESNRPPVDRGDTVLSLPMLNRLYNVGLHHGELRLWNPYLFCGYPLYNNLLVHPFYPPNMILHAVAPPRIAYDLNLMLHFFFSGAAMYALLRGMGRSVPAAALGGVLWMLIGYNSFWFSTGTFMGASVFAPLALLGIHLGLARRNLAPFALGGAAMGMIILGSHGQHALHVMIFLSLWIGVSMLRDRFALKGGLVFVAAALGVGMAAILTQLDSVLNGLRVPGDDAKLHYELPGMLLTCIPNLVLGKVCYAPTGLLRSEFTIYAGVAGTTLAVVGAVRGFRDPWIRYIAIVAVVALLAAFVKPLALLLLQIPGLNLSMPARWVYILGLCVTLLAAVGLDAMVEDPAKSFRVAIASIGASLVLFAFYLSQGAVAETLVGLGLAAAWLFTSRKPRLSLAFCFAALLVDLLPNFVLFNSHGNPDALEDPRAQTVVAADPAPWRATGSMRFQSGLATPTPWTIAIGSNLLALYGVEAVMGYESIAPLWTAEYCYSISPNSIMGSGRVLAVFNLKSRLLDIANMRYVFMPFPYPDVEPRFRKLETRGPLTIYENPTALPRAYLVQRALRAANVNEAAKILKSEEFDPRTTVVLEENEIPRTGDGGGSVAWKVRETDHVEWLVQARADTLLVVSDTYYPGWEATIDGAAAPILRANLAFRAVAVPAGSHRVAMRFRPPSARNGLVVTALSILAVLGLYGWKQFKLRKSRGILPS